MSDIVERLREIARMKGWGSHSEAADEITRLRSELEQCQQAAFRAMEWQPIETAPKNGDEVLLFREDAGVILARWTSPIEFLTEREIESSNLSENDANEDDWFYADFVQGGRLDDEPATHWMPLPPPPVTP